MLLTTEQKKELLKKLVSYDPLVGDTACQIRATHLLSLYQSILERNPCHISEDESKYIDYCQHLTGLTKIPKSQRSTIAEQQSFIAKQGIEFLKNVHASLSENQLLHNYLNVNLLSKISAQSKSQSIAILPCFISTNMMLQYMKNTAALLIINIKRMIVMEDQSGTEHLWRSNHLLPLYKRHRISIV